MPRPLLLLLFLSCSCSQAPVPEMSADPGTLDSTLTARRLRCAMPVMNMNMYDTIEGSTKRSTFFIENDTLYFHQFLMYDVMLSHDEEFRTDLCIAVPMEIVRTQKNIPVHPDSGKALCTWTSINNWDSEEIRSSFNGTINLWYRSSYDLENGIMFTGNIYFTNNSSPKFPYRIIYNDFGFADYGDYDLWNLPPDTPRKRHVWR